MNNKGFTLIEFITTTVVISLILFVVVREIGSTVSITKNESYNLMKENISKAAKNYINECNNNIQDCKIDWNNNEISFKADLLMKNNYFNNLKSPIDGKDLSNCLTIIATKEENETIETIIEDNCY